MSDNNVVIKRLLELKGSDTQSEFADKINTTQANVSKMLSGKTPPSASTLISLATIYNVSVDWILGLSDSREHSSNLDVGNLTYADVLAVISQLYKKGTVTMGYDYNSYGNEVDPGSLLVQDKVLLFLLDALNNCAGNDDIAAMWQKKTYKDFSETQLLEWNQNIDTFYQHNLPSQKSNEAVVKWVNDVKNRDIKIKDILDTIDDELPFK